MLFLPCVVPAFDRAGDDKDGGGVRVPVAMAVPSLSDSPSLLLQLQWAYKRVARGR
jgi:hypothetical protein